MIRTALLGVLTVILAMTMKQGKAEYSTFVSFAGSILIGWIAISLMRGMLGSFERLTKLIFMEREYITLLLKLIGITYLAEFSSALCKDAGYQAVAGQIELVGKLTILAMGLPIVLSLFETIAAME